MQQNPIFIPKITSIISVIILIFLGNICSAQSNEFETALAKFTGEHKWDIELPHSMDNVKSPDFSGTTLDGKIIKSTDLKGKVVVLNFWFIACKPCRLEVTPLNEVVKQFAGKDVVFLSIAREKAQDLEKHLKTTEFLFQTIADPTFLLVDKTFHLFGYPTTIVIDRFGKIQYYSLGGKIDENAVRLELQKKLVPVINDCLVKTKES